MLFYCQLHVMIGYLHAKMATARMDGQPIVAAVITADLDKMIAAAQRPDASPRFIQLNMAGASELFQCLVHFGRIADRFVVDLHPRGDGRADDLVKLMQIGLALHFQLLRGHAAADVTAK